MSAVSAVAAEPAAAVDQARVGQFVAQAMGDMSGAIVSILCTLGDRLGLFKALAAAGAVTSADLAAAVGVDERYTREWLRALTTTGYLAYDPATERFRLPPEHAVVLAWEGQPMFLGGAYQQLAGLFAPLARLTDAFRRGGGVPDEVYEGDLHEGMERLSAGWFENLLVPCWLPAMPDIAARLERGGLAADIGCGAGRALVVLARAFPRSRFVGYDVSESAVARATANAAAGGVHDRVRFECLDAAGGLPEQYDLVTTFDALHDLPDVGGVLRAIRRALLPGGTYLLMEVNCSDRLEQNRGPVSAILYGTSLLYCLPTALARGAEGLGTMGLPEARIRALCAEAGFGAVRRLPVENPFNVLYDVRP